MIIRKATTADVGLLVRLRLDFLASERGELTPGEQTAVTEQLLRYFPKHLENNSFIGVLAEDQGEIHSAAFLSIAERPANPVFITGLVGTLANVYTYPQHRRKGTATKVLLAILEEARQAGVSSIDLAATEDGKLLYHKLGFKELSYTSMRLKLL